MLRLSIMATILTTGLALANDPPPVPEGGFALLGEMPCGDQETGQEGYCYFLLDVEGNQYVTFWQGETLQFIRRITADGYEVVWVNDTYNGI